jgi:single-strand DNA-binding protein
MAPRQATKNDDNEGMTYDDVDYPSFQDIDFTELDPLHDMDFEEYEEYLKNAPDEEIIWDDSVPTLNQVYLVGRVGNPPESRNLPDDNMVVTLSIALPRYYNYWERDDLQIEYGKEETEWFNLEVWGQTADFVMKNVEKGMRVGVIGSIDTDYYQNKNTGKLSSNCKVLVQDLDILESKMETDSRKDGSQQQQQRGPSMYSSPDDYDDDNDDDDDSDFGPLKGSAGGFFDPF